jgi:hypothetical protein
MFSKMEIALSAAIILCTALTASASTSTKNHAVSRVHHRAIYNAAPEPIITNQCLPTDNPCRTRPDDY